MAGDKKLQAEALALTAPDSTAATANAPKGQALMRRVISAFVLIAVAVAAAVASIWTFAILVGIIGILIILEWQDMTGLERTSPPAVLQSAVVITVAGFVAAGYSSMALGVLGLGALGAAVAARIHNLPMSYTAAGVFAVGVPALAAIWLRDMPDVGAQIILWLFAVVWASDSGAYAAGRWLGGPAFAPDVSPNKTWAGVAGGYVAAFTAGLVSAWLLFGADALVFWAFTTGVAAFAAQAGDISESAFKRHIGVKDSGTLIPGHGGVFDRLDGFLMASTVVAVWILGAVLWALL